MNKVIFMGETCTVRSDIYSLGGTVLQLIDQDGLPYATATMWISGLEKDEVAIKNYSENEGMLHALMSAGIVEAPHRTVLNGYVTVPVCKLMGREGE